MGISRRLDELTDLACTSRGEVAGPGCGGGARGLAEERQRVEPLRRDLAAALRALEALKAQTARTSAEAIAREARSGLARSHGLGISPGPAVSHSRPRLTVHLLEYMSTSSAGAQRRALIKWTKKASVGSFYLSRSWSLASW